MDRIHHPTTAASPPDVDSHGTAGYPTEGDPIGGIEATVLTAWTGHSLIEEMRNVIAAAQITPDKADLTQLLAAIRVLAAPEMQVVTSTASVTVPSWSTHARVRLWGGGGGGGGANQPGAAAGGGAGGYAEGIYAVTPGASILATVGAGGTEGAATPTNGGAGGTSSFGSLVSATGGGGGQLNLGGISTFAGAGGAGTGGEINISGGSGGQGFQISTGNFVAGPGGAPFGGSITLPTFNALGVPGPAPGNGGGGAAAAAAAAAGQPGLIIVEWMA